LNSIEFSYLTTGLSAWKQKNFYPQSAPVSCCYNADWPLALQRKSLGETEKNLGEKAAVTSDRYFFARERLTRLEKTIEQFSTLESFDLGRTRQLFTLRVDITRLAVESVGLEAEIKGGKGYFRNSDTAATAAEGRLFTCVNSEPDSTGKRVTTSVLYR
jgi:hypothetical protein